MEHFQFSKTLIILLLTTYCESQPLELIANTSDDTATICPELANATLEKSDAISVKAVNLQEENLPLKTEDENFIETIQISPEISEQATTIFSEKLEKKILEENSKQNELDPVKTVKDEENARQFPRKNSEEFQKQKLEKNAEILDKSLPDTQGNLQEKLDTAEISKNPEETTICPEELERLQQEENKENSNQNLQKIQEKFDFAKTRENAENLEETNTICPEELEKLKLKNSKENLNHVQENLQELDFVKTSNNEENSSHIMKNPEESTTICPEENEKRKLEKIEENLNQSSKETQSDVQEDADPVAENSGEISTPCPEELEKRQLEQFKEDIQDIPQKTMLTLQEDDVLYKNVENGHNVDSSRETYENPDVKKKLEQSQEFLIKFKELVHKAQKGKHSKSKRQTADYSSYYMNQPSYNPQGVAVSNTAVNQQQSSYNPQGYNLQGLTASKTNQNQQDYDNLGYNAQSYSPQGGLSTSNTNSASNTDVKTYQQIQRQYQTAQKYQKNTSSYPQTYRNNLKPVKTYRNPGTYVRYPSNGSLKNYYRLNNLGNRRQFQGARPFTSTSIRPNVRVTRKKFKPSPVFA